MRPGTTTTGRSIRDLPRWVSRGTLALTLLAVLALYTYDLAAAWVEVGVLTVANLVATLVRFLALRIVIGRHGR